MQIRKDCTYCFPSAPDLLEHEDMKISNGFLHWILIYTRRPAAWVSPREAWVVWTLQRPEKASKDVVIWLSLGICQLARLRRKMSNWLTLGLNEVKMKSVSYSVLSNSLQSSDCSPPGSSVHGLLQVRILEWIAVFFSRASSWPRGQTQVSCTADRVFTITREASF